MNYWLNPTTIFGTAGIIILILQALMFAIIKFNDLKHLGRAVDEIKATLNVISEDIKETNKEITSVKERIARIEGALEVSNED
jgi:hypothetical protein